LTDAGRDSEICDGRVVCFAGTVRDYRSVPVCARQFDAAQGFRNRADLVQLDQDGVGDVLLDAFGENLGVGNEDVVSD
jgi:hypothetical protein